MTHSSKKGLASMSFSDKRIYTANDYWNLPEGHHAELIHGKLYDMASPSRIHQKLITRFVVTISNYITSHNGDCEIYPAPFAVNLFADNSVIVEPDIFIVCDKDKLTDRECKGAPDFVIEIVSPSNRKMDYSIKNGQYAASGVREYWIVDPEKICTTIYRFEEDAMPVIIPFNQPIKVGIYEDLYITIAKLLQ